MSKQVTAVYKDRRSMANAVEQLVRNAGIARDDISVLMSEETRGREFAQRAASKAPEGAVTGVATGGVLGAVAAALVAVGTVAAPGVGLVAAGPVIAALAGAGAGGAAGGLVGGLIGLGIPEHEAELISHDVEQGAILLGVQAHDDRSGEVERILEDTGGTHVR
jgi:hypothetical protein